MIEFLPAIGAESARFLAAIESIDAAGTALTDVRVPACPDWNAADLAWHLTEVQAFWATMVGGGLSSPAEAEMPERPADDQVLALFAEQSERLVSVLTDGADEDPCWSWHPTGGNIGWVRRRQAQEALIHRIDAEQTAALVTAAPLSDVDEVLATDGIDEMIQIMLSSEPLPEWGRFEPSDRSLRITVPQRSWDLTIGRVVGTNDDGPQDAGAVRVEEDPLASPGATLTGSAAEIDLWLWRRGLLTDASVRGNQAVVQEVYDFSSVE
ncbi:MAG: maleylpyruvate isomerase family mycothiol-dependent enzyme [Actinomycetota bacterium]